MVAVDAVLLCAGMPALRPALRRTVLARARVVLTRLAALLVPGGARYEIFAARPVPAALITGPVLLLLPVLHGRDGIRVIAGTAVLGAGLAAAGLMVRRAPGTAPRTVPRDHPAATA